MGIGSVGQAKLAYREQLWASGSQAMLQVRSAVRPLGASRMEQMAVRSVGAELPAPPPCPPPSPIPPAFMSACPPPSPVLSSQFVPWQGMSSPLDASETLISQLPPSQTTELMGIAMPQAVNLGWDGEVIAAQLRAAMPIRYED